VLVAAHHFNVAVDDPITRRQPLAHIMPDPVRTMVSQGTVYRIDITPTRRSGRGVSAATARDYGANRR
jgi:hypothetical protein